MTGVLFRGTVCVRGKWFGIVAASGAASDCCRSARASRAFAWPAALTCGGRTGLCLRAPGKAPVLGLASHQSFPLRAACMQGHHGIAKFLLEHGARVDQQRVDTGSTALHAAAFHGHTATCRLLLAQGADVTIQKKLTGMTALHLAAQEGNEGTLSLLLRARADPSLRSFRNGITALHLAVNAGCLGMVRSLAALDVDGVNTPAGTEGSMPLHIATAGGHVDIAAHLLMDAGASPNAAR